MVLVAQSCSMFAQQFDQVTLFCQKSSSFQNSKTIFMISDFNIFPIMLSILLNFGLLSVYLLFHIYYKGKTLLSLICSFSFCCLVKEGLTVKVASQFDIGGLIDYKPITYKKIVYSLIINVIVSMLCLHFSFNFVEKIQVNRSRVNACF